MGAWYWIGVCAGLGAGIGVLLAGLAGATRAALLAAGLVALAAGAGAGYAVDRWQPGSWGDALAVAGLAWVPALGYVEALALPALAARLRRRAPERYAGLRTLAKD
jgi:hypothetical protein